jgi:hypothetical protein
MAPPPAVGLSAGMPACGPAAERVRVDAADRSADGGDAPKDHRRVSTALYDARASARGLAFGRSAREVLLDVVTASASLRTTGRPTDCLPISNVRCVPRGRAVRPSRRLRGRGTEASVGDTGGGWVYILPVRLFEGALFLQGCRRRVRGGGGGGGGRPSTSAPPRMRQTAAVTFSAGIGGARGGGRNGVVAAAATKDQGTSAAAPEYLDRC